MQKLISIYMYAKFTYLLIEMLKYRKNLIKLNKAKNK